MARINTDDRSVFEVEASVEDIRKFFDGANDLPEDVTTALDEAQGFVHTGEGSEAILVLRIKK